MRLLVWQWGRFGAMPRFAMLLAEGLRALPGTEVALSLSSGAELLRSATPPRCELPVATYAGPLGFALRAAAAPFAVGRLAARVAALRPEIAICAHPGPLDLLMAAALDRLHVPFVTLVHDADLHPGDGLPLQMLLQRLLCRRSAAIGALSTYVGERLRAQALVATTTTTPTTGTTTGTTAGAAGRPLIRLRHPPVAFRLPPGPPRGTGGPRVLLFGRLLPYKGLDLLAEALARLGPRPGLAVRVVGTGPDSAALRALRATPGVTVENRWVPEDEIGALLAWSDVLVLPYREASQSGVAAAALAAGRWVVATRVGGLPEQLAGTARGILCEPDADSLAAALLPLLDAARNGLPGAATPPDSATEWRTMADSLLRQIAALGLCRPAAEPLDAAPVDTGPSGTEPLGGALP